MVTAEEDEWFDTEHPHGRDGLGPAPEKPRWDGFADYLRRPFGGDGDSAGTARPDVVWRTRGDHMTVRELCGALAYADDDDRVQVVGREVRFFKQKKKQD